MGQDRYSLQQGQSKVAIKARPRPESWTNLCPSPRRQQAHSDTGFFEGAQMLTSKKKNLFLPSDYPQKNTLLGGRYLIEKIRLVADSVSFRLL